MKALPTFASAADYAKMLEDDTDEDMGWAGLWEEWNWPAKRFRWSKFIMPPRIITELERRKSLDLAGRPICGQWYPEAQYVRLCSVYGYQCGGVYIRAGAHGWKHSCCPDRRRSSMIQKYHSTTMSGLALLRFLHQADLNLCPTCITTLVRRRWNPASGLIFIARAGQGEYLTPRYPGCPGFLGHFCFGMTMWFAEAEQAGNLDLALKQPQDARRHIGWRQWLELTHVALSTIQLRHSSELQYVHYLSSSAHGESSYVQRNVYIITRRPHVDPSAPMRSCSVSPPVCRVHTICG